MLGAMLLAGLAVGLWPRAIYPRLTPVEEASLPTLRALAVFHAVFVLLVWPLDLMRRSRRGGGAWGRVVLAAAVQFLVSVPFYVAAAWVSDAQARDVARTLLYLACLVPLGWAAGKCMAFSKQVGAGVLLGLLVLLGGCPAAFYVAREFLPAAADPAWLWHLGPVTGAWSAAASRLGTVIPQPLWPLACYLVAALAAAVLAVRLGKARQ